MIKYLIILISINIAFADEPIPQIPLPNLYVIKNDIFNLIEYNPATECLKQSTLVLKSPLIMSKNMNDCVHNQIKNAEIKPLINQIKSSSGNISQKIITESKSAFDCIINFSGINSFLQCFKLPFSF